MQNKNTQRKSYSNQDTAEKLQNKISYRKEESKFLDKLNRVALGVIESEEIEEEKIGLNDLENQIKNAAS